MAVFMYLYKYLFKGPDHMYFHVQQDNDNTIDKVSNYVDGCYLSAPEAVWRILGFKITSMDPSVTCLPVHLPGENIPQFVQGTSDQGWEHSDPLDEDEYLKEPIHHSTQNKLLHTIEGTLYHTYHEAALSVGLFNNINEGYFALEEPVANHQLPTQLCFLFAQIILKGYPALPLWNHFCGDLTFDYISQSSSEHISTDHALQQIASYLKDGCHSLKDFGLLEPQYQSAEIITELEAFSGRESELEHQAQQMKTWPWEDLFS
ncbi:uncharacterized protein BJ212DRAFT_1298673 [Suillus subaureus]|uniref:Uncharacterized protein n=1 Tax=Suillus subaureus TaxID=48587 RepID=A0A9P7EDJ1_9AGAM|nr:uncharacterized protein BJ212DRAFT_1298673 [Suillus subaureus]KAG1818600.1 hypothetical protein BJ212DRAFT_1298673 [Suillus subaureus]